MSRCCCATWRPSSWARSSGAARWQIEHGEQVGGIVTMRYGANPQTVIEGVKEEILKLEPALPEGVEHQRILRSHRADRRNPRDAHQHHPAEILITVVVVMLFLMHLRSG
jgi:copper/silver efflux system protein